jgi:hypothetical protein
VFSEVFLCSGTPKPAEGWQRRPVARPFSLKSLPWP